MSHFKQQTRTEWALFSVQTTARHLAAARVAQPTLFELKEDYRPACERTAAVRYREPSLFTLLDGEG